MKGYISGVPLSETDMVEHVRLTKDAEIASLRAELERVKGALRELASAIASADPDDTIGSIKVDIPKDGYPRQYIQNAVPDLIAALAPSPTGMVVVPLATIKQCEAAITDLHFHRPAQGAELILLRGLRALLKDNQP